MEEGGVNIPDAFYNLSGGQVFRDLTGVGTLVSLGVRIAFVIAGLLVLFFIIFAGYSLISSAGQNDPKQGAVGKQAATAAVAGAVIVFSSYWIVQLVEALTGIVIL